MEIQGYFTKKGLALLTKLSAGSTLTITRVLAGSGHTADPVSAAALPAVRQSLTVNTARRSGNTAIIPATLTAAQTSTAYTLTELGVYAKDPEEGEILYKLYQLAEPVDITPGSRMVLRFYLEETVSEASEVTVACSPAGLITEAEFLPVRDKLMTSRVSACTVTLEASELSAYLNSLPRLLTENYTITVNGALNAQLIIDNFYGNGHITIKTDGVNSFSLNHGLYISNCRIPIQLWDSQLTAPSGLDAGSGLVSVYQSRYVRLADCTLTGHEKEENVWGARIEEGSHALFESCTFSGFDGVVFAGRLSSGLFYGSADHFSGNNKGAYVWMGGRVMLGGSVPDTLGGSANIKSGGMIVKADGTLL